jgi:hypothetical protein
MAKSVNTKISKVASLKKKTVQGNGVHTKHANAGGETFHDNQRAGSPPSARRRRGKRYRGQGR